MSVVDPVQYQHPGATDETVYMEFEDREGDTYYDEVEKVPVEALVVIIFVLGVVVTVFLFWFLIRNDRLKRAAMLHVNHNKDDHNNINNNINNNNGSKPGQSDLEGITVVVTTSSSSSGSGEMDSPTEDGFMSTGESKTHQQQKYAI